MRIAAALLAGLCLLLLSTTAWSWDGQWTNARSGLDLLRDESDSTGDAGTDERPQKFLIPPERMFNEVDPEELGEYEGKDYAPYALARFPYTFLVKGRSFPQGYYLVKMGQAMDGSVTTHARSVANANLPDGLPADTTHQPAPGAAKQKKPKDGDPANYQTLIIKKLGTVMLVLPIQQVSAYTPPKGYKPPKNPVAWVEMQDKRPVLRFYYKKYIYSTDLSALG